MLDLSVCIPTPTAQDRHRQQATVTALILTAAKCLQSTLHISGFHALVALPSDIENLTRIRSLTVTHNYSLAVLPPEVETLVTLEACVLSYNALTRVPSELCRLRYLTTMDLANNALSYLPSALHRMKSLRVLNVECNLLTCVPAELGLMPVLEDLCVEGNPLVSDGCAPPKRPTDEVIKCAVCSNMCGPGEIRNGEAVSIHFVDVAGARRNMWPPPSPKPRADGRCLFGCRRLKLTCARITCTGLETLPHDGSAAPASLVVLSGTSRTPPRSHGHG